MRWADPAGIALAICGDKDKGHHGREGLRWQRVEEEISGCRTSMTEGGYNVRYDCFGEGNQVAKPNKAGIGKPDGVGGWRRLW